MFGDSHFHLSYLEERGIDLYELFTQLYQNKVPFLLDIGTHCDDLFQRLSLASKLIDAFSKDKEKEDALSIASFIQERLYFAAGIWPHATSILNREEELAVLSSAIRKCKKEGFENISPSHLIALGECGLDHHWNKAHFDGLGLKLRLEDFLAAEAEFFEMQLALAEKEALPVLVHSRDAFEATLSCIKNMGYHRGIIHCYAYGIEEARAFLDLGWYISFSGSITYAKKNKLQAYEDLVRFIPSDRLLLETDAPYLAPGKYRGRVNTPALIGETYFFVSQARAMSMEDLALLVEKNMKDLFMI